MLLARAAQREIRQQQSTQNRSTTTPRAVTRIDPRTP
jgi:hypothetical protein